MRRLVLASILVLCISGLSFGIVIDGSSSDWLAKGTIADPQNDHPGGVSDLRAWQVAAQKDSGVNNLYAYFQDPRMSEWVAPNNVFASVWIDVDRTGGFTSTKTLAAGNTGWDGPSSIGVNIDNAGLELVYPQATEGTINNGGNAFMGIDTMVEWGPANEGFNFWGAGDDAMLKGSAITGGATALGSNFIEFRVPVSEITADVASNVDKVTPKLVWKVGVRLAAHIDANGGGSTWEGDKSGDAGNPNGGVTVFTYVPVATVFGDASEDGKVDVSDLGILAANYGTTYNLSTGVDTWAKGDFNADGKIDVSDLGILAANYGTSFVGTVPEPMTMSLLAMGGLALLRRKS